MTDNLHQDIVRESLRATDKRPETAEAFKARVLAMLEAEIVRETATWQRQMGASARRGEIGPDAAIIGRLYFAIRSLETT